MKTFLPAIVLPFAIAIAGAAYSSSGPARTPYYGVNPDTGLCELGELDGVCGNGVAVSCTVFIDRHSDISAYEVKTSALCATALYKAARPR
jgi:hypothetical protein